LGDYEAFRRWFIRVFSFAIPTPSSVAELLDAFPPDQYKFADIGGGSGYWKRLLRASGCDVLACDSQVRDTDLCFGRWDEVVEANGDDFVRDNEGLADRVLLYCWSTNLPGIDHYQGDSVVVIGEDEGGCTGNLLHAGASEWLLQKTIPLHQWPGNHDAIWIFQRGRAGFPYEIRQEAIIEEKMTTLSESDPTAFYLRSAVKYNGAQGVEIEEDSGADEEVETETDDSVSST